MPGSKALLQYKVIDISQPIASATACWAGDTPFSKQITAAIAHGSFFNLTAFTMSAHVGTHADAQLHCRGDFDSCSAGAGELPLEPFVGPAYVIDLAPHKDAIKPEHINRKLSNLAAVPQRLLFKTSTAVNPYIFADSCAYFDQTLVPYLKQNNIVLAGIDTASVDHAHCQSLSVHNELIDSGVFWIENLDLSDVEEGEYFLVALPLKLMELEAAPVRAALLTVQPCLQKDLFVDDEHRR